MILKIKALLSALGVATTITLLVVLFGFFSIFNLKFMGIDWRNTFIQFQTFFSTLSVLAAGLFAYYASTSGTKEAQRKNAEDQMTLRHNILVKATLAVEMVRAESNAKLYRLWQFSDEYTQEKIPILMYKELCITMPQQLLEILNDLSCLPEDIYINLSGLILHIQGYISIHHRDINIYNEKIEKLKEDVAIFTAILQTNRFDRTSKETVDEFLEDYVNRRNTSFEESRSIRWHHAGKILEDINRITLAILKFLPLSKEWMIHDQVPYPSEFIRNEVG